MENFTQASATFERNKNFDSSTQTPSSPTNLSLVKLLKIGWLIQLLFILTIITISLINNSVSDSTLTKINFGFISLFLIYNFISSFFYFYQKKSAKTITWLILNLLNIVIYISGLSFFITLLSAFDPNTREKDLWSNFWYQISNLIGFLISNLHPSVGLLLFYLTSFLFFAIPLGYLISTILTWYQLKKKINNSEKL